jgi:hypothetical protein
VQVGEGPKSVVDPVLRPHGRPRSR